MDVATLGVRLPASRGTVSEAHLGFIRNHVSAWRRQASVCQRLILRCSLDCFRLDSVRYNAVWDGYVMFLA
jgi:hypothetical protein